MVSGRSLFLSVLLLPAALLSQKAPVPPFHGQSLEEALKEAPAALESILEKDLRKHAFELASKAYQGRLTGTPGQIKTAEYIAAHFRKLGLKPLRPLAAGKGGKKRGRPSFFQGYPITLNKVLEGSGLLDSKGRLLHRHGGWLSSDGEKVETAGKLIFLGRGRRGDFEGQDLKGLIPVLDMTLPKKNRRMTVMRAMGEGFRLLGKLRGLAKRASENGARGLVVLYSKFPTSLANALNFVGIYPGKPRVSLEGKRRGGMSFMMRTKVPVLVLGDEDASEVLGVFGLEFETLRKDREEGKSSVGELSKGTYSFRFETEVEHSRALNVCAYLPGRDPKLKKEAVVYSGHMDHLGMAPDGRIFFGADDNGSGTSCILEIAEAYAKLPKRLRPKRSILFLIVSGEELGLWGSAHFVEHPRWRLEDLVADINMDMVGRSTDKVPSDAIALTPTYRNRDFSTLAGETAWLGKAFGLRMTNGDRFYRRSDHYNFAKKGIPVVFFCDDEHADYHMPTDTPDKLEFEKMVRVSRLSFLLGYRVANRAERPERIGRSEGWFEGN